MPITGEYSWSEKSDRILVSVPLKGASPSKVDIYVTSNTLKVNYSPYLLDLVLKGRVNSVKHKAIVKEGVLVITLLKESAGTWGDLLCDVRDKTTLLEIKKYAVEGQTEKEKDLQAERKDKKIDEEKHALRKQMKLDEGERTLIENLKQEEKETAEAAMYKTFANMEKEKQQASAPVVASSSVNAKGKKAVQFAGDQDKPKTSDSNIFADSDLTPLERYLQNDDIDLDGDDGEDLDDELTGKSAEESVFTRSTAAAAVSAAAKGVPTLAPDDIEQEEGAGELDADIRFVPPPRSGGYNADTRVEIKYTPRVFPTPMRESKASEEEDWIARNRQNLKKHAVLGKGVQSGGDVSESDPAWLKAKADDFFRAGDVRSALNAYSAAIDIDDTATSCYSNRAACYMKLGMFKECTVDCDTALERSLSSSAASGEKVSAKQLTLNKLYLRRGTAMSQLGKYAEAIKDYSKILGVLEQRAADGLDSGNISKEAIKKDLEKLQTVSAADSLKKAADESMGQGELVEALEKYSEALKLLPSHVGCLSNRSACRMSLGDKQGCVDDCSAALALLQLNSVNDSASGTIGGVEVDLLASIIPPPGSDKRLKWVLKTVIRRGAAHAALNNLDAAVTDYTTGSSLDPKNESLLSDLTKIKNYRTGMKELEQNKEATTKSVNL